MRQSAARKFHYVTVKVIDERGDVVPTADNLVHFSTEGPGQIVATDSGDPTSLRAFSSPDREAFNGPSLAIVEEDLKAIEHDEPRSLVIRAESAGLTPARLQLNTK